LSFPPQLQGGGSGKPAGAMPMRSHALGKLRPIGELVEGMNQLEREQPPLASPARPLPWRRRSRRQRPALPPNKTLAAQLYGAFKSSTVNFP
jgi:hypothetical protein